MKRLCLYFVFMILYSLSAQYPAGVDTVSDSWIPYPLSSFCAMKGSALDMSWLLEAPAGSHGFLTVEKERFVFEDGTPARFWGGNIFGEANFPEKNEAEHMADIIARSGANIVRMHHLDVVKPWTDKIVQRNLFGGQMPKTTRKLDSEMLDKFQYMFHCLKERGIYIFLSHVSSRFIMPGDDFPGDKAGFADADQGFKVEGVFDPFLVELQKEYLQQLFTVENPYTGLALKDDPALVLTEVINENTLFWLHPEGWFAINSPYYAAMLERRFAQWLIATYASEDKLIEAWQTPGKTALFENESLEAGHIQIPDILETEDTWPVSQRRRQDTYQFLYDLQREYYEQMAGFLKQIGVKIPIAGSNHWCLNAADLHVNARLDYVDRHDYWTHPENEYNYIQGQGIQSLPMVKDSIGGIIGNIARRRVFGKPYTVSEWHNPLPNPYRAEGTPLMAAFSSLHGWHPMHYAYWGTREAQPDTINSFEVFFDPTQMNLIPISALLFLRQDFSEDDKGFYEVMSPERVMHPDQEAALNPQLALLGKYGMAFTDQSLPEKNNSEMLKTVLESNGRFKAVTGEIDWDTRRGVVVLNSPRTQGVVGFTADQKLETADLSFEMSTTFCVVIASSLTDQPLLESKDILISTSADARFSDIQISDDFGIIEKTGHFPFLMQPVYGTITLKTAKSVRVTALDCGGQPVRELPVHQVEGGYTFQMINDKGMHYRIEHIIK